MDSRWWIFAVSRIRRKRFAPISERKTHGWVEGAVDAGEIECKGRQDFFLGHDGGYMLPIHIKIGQGMRTHFENL